MENLQFLLSGFSVLFTGQNILIACLGAILGIFVGAMPGIGSLAGVALLLPLTYGMNATSAIVLLCTLYYACMFGGSYSAILLNIPGDSPAIMTTLDGYPLAKKGRAGKALMTANMSSFVGGFIGMVILTYSAVGLARLGLKFGPAEMTTLLMLALTSVTWLIGENPIKGLIATLIGALLTCIGTDPINASLRLTFHNIYLLGGLPFTPLVIGAVGFSQVIGLVTEKDGQAVSGEKLSVKKNFLTKHEWKRILPVCLRNGVLGTIVGILPGAGATTASMVGYMTQKKLFKSEEPLGEGAIEGIASCESANNAACSGCFAPLLALGIPGSSTGSVLLGGLMMWGLQPGPLLFTTNSDFAWGCIASLFFANIFALLCGLLLVPILSKVICVPNGILVPVVTMICIAGSYSCTRSIYGVVVMFVAGVVCYFLVKHKYPMAPLLLAFVLAPMLETYMRRAFASSAGKISIFWSSPISAVCLAIFIITIMTPIVSMTIAKIKKHS